MPADFPEGNFHARQLTAREADVRQHLIIKVHELVSQPSAGLTLGNGMKDPSRKIEEAMIAGRSR